MKPLLIACLTICLGSELSAQKIYFPSLLGNSWETLSPEELGWCSPQIDILYDFLEGENTKSFLILKDGRIVLEKYFGTYTKDSLWFWFSAGKSLTAVLTGIAQQQGMLDIDDRTADYLGENWTSLEGDKEDLITIKNQLTMTSGLDETEFSCTNQECLNYTADAGTRWVYHNSPYSLLRNVIENASGMGYNDFTKTYISNKTGMAGSWISSGFNNFFVSRARDMARFGLVVMNNGFWDTTAILDDEQFLNDMTNSSQSLNPSYGYLWWLNGKSSFIAPSGPASIDGTIAPDAPEDVYAAAGAQGQFISINPDRGLMMIRQGTSTNEDKAAINLQNEIWKHIQNLECSITSIDTNHQQTTKWSIYPNPSNNYINISGFGEIQGIYINDATGKTFIASLEADELNIRHLPPGMYVLKIIASDGNYIKRFIKN